MPEDRESGSGEALAMTGPGAGGEEKVHAILLKTFDLARKTLTAAMDSAPGEDISRMEVMDVGEGDLTPAGPLPFSTLEAEFLIGLSFRIELGSVIYASQEREDLGVLLTRRGWFRRTSAYEEIADYSFAEYVYAFVLPYYRDLLRTVENAGELVAQNDLRFIAADLRGNEKIRHFANTNDFLTTDEDVAWLTELLGESNVRFYERGGHLGSLHKPEVQAEVMQALADLANP